jgi:microcompartment protein CcmL/EutN
MDNLALGSFETIGFVAALNGADAALKSADVKLLGCQYVGSGLVSVLLTGDVSSVKVAVESGCSAAKQVGTVQSYTVIARTAEGLESIVTDAKLKRRKRESGKGSLSPQQHKPSKSAATVVESNSLEISVTDLAAMRVTQLRDLARKIPGISLERRVIRSARKDELIAAITSCYQQDKE